MKPLISLIFCLSLFVCMSTQSEATNEFKLPKPNFAGKMSTETAMTKKKSVRHFAKDPLTLDQVSQLLWAANGNLPVDAISGATVKTLASAGGIYPLEIFLVTGDRSVNGLSAGIFRYNPVSNSLSQIFSGDARMALSQAALSQLWMASAPVTIVIAGAFGKSTAKYGPRGIQYTFMESGASNQNLYLQAESIGLRIGTVGAFDENAVSASIKLPAGVTPLLLVPVGR
jgi:SagB-type dehydrogenase family enzyme